MYQEERHDKKKTRTILHLLAEDDHEAEHQYSHRNAIYCFLQTETFTQDTPDIFSCAIWQTHSMALEFAFHSAEHREVSFLERIIIRTENK